MIGTEPPIGLLAEDTGGPEAVAPIPATAGIPAKAGAAQTPTSGTTTKLVPAINALVRVARLFMILPCQIRTGRADDFMSEYE